MLKMKRVVTKKTKSKEKNDIVCDEEGSQEILEKFKMILKMGKNEEKFACIIGTTSSDFDGIKPPYAAWPLLNVVSKHLLTARYRIEQILDS